ncbi:MAG: RusA family crossover junction endodeoxyribonuclease [Acholeplasmatales bacterium]|nr:RusA family crossover junction endodeoxyribonuclease [Acholeplasmatales bacterium]
MDNQGDNKKGKSPVSFDPDLIGHKFVSFSVEGEPFAKQRPRAARRGRFVTIYTPRETKQYEAKVRDSYKKRYQNQYIQQEQLTGALTVKIDAVFKIPSNTSKKTRELMLNNKIQHTKKPDVDNVGKSCLDGMNGIAYPDDAIINKLIVTKKYGENPRVDITIIQK